MRFSKWIVFQVFVFLFTMTNVQAQNVSVDELCKDTFATSRHTEVFGKPVKSRHISGRILSTDKSGIQDATVTLTDETYKKVVSSVLTDRSGNFFIRNSLPAKYYLIVCKPGFDPVKFIVDLQPKHGKKKITFTLSPS